MWMSSVSFFEGITEAELQAGEEAVQYSSAYLNEARRILRMMTMFVEGAKFDLKGASSAKIEGAFLKRMEAKWGGGTRNSRYKLMRDFGIRPDNLEGAALAIERRAIIKSLQVGDRATQPLRRKDYPSTEEMIRLLHYPCLRDSEDDKELEAIWALGVASGNRPGDIVRCPFKLEDENGPEGVLILWLTRKGGRTTKRKWTKYDLRLDLLPQRTRRMLKRRAADWKKLRAKQEDKLDTVWEVVKKMRPVNDEELGTRIASRLNQWLKKRRPKGPAPRSAWRSTTPRDVRSSARGKMVERGELKVEDFEWECDHSYLTSLRHYQQ